MKLTDADNAADGIFFPALEQNMMGAVLINENDEVMFFNPAAEKLWGYKREEVIGNNIDMLIPRDLRPAHPEYIRHNREGGKARVEGMSRELQLEKKDGSKIWTRFALSKVSAEGKVYYLALVRDASVEMAQKEQTRQLIIAVDHLDRPVIVLNPERHIVQCNRAFTEMFGYCISEASGMQPDTLLNIPEFPADNRIRLQQLLWKTARDQDEFLLLTRTGEKIWIKASISPVYDVLAHLQNLVMTFSDITEERQIRQLEGNILAAMCSSPPFHEMGKSFVVTSNLFSTNRMFRCSHCATGCRYTGRHLRTVQKFKMRKAGQRPFVSVMARLRGSCKLKPRQEQKPAPLSNAWQISVSIWPRWRWNRKKAASILNNSSNLIR